jgi:hypothetical protein
VLGDTVHEPDETFSVLISSPQHATIADGEGVGRIIDDDEGSTALIYGTVFEDSNQNGLQDNGEAGISGVAVYLDPYGAPLQQPMALLDGGYYAVTDPDGHYSIETTFAGQHTVFEADPIGYGSTTSNMVQLQVVSGGRYQVDFGDTKQEVCTCSPDLYEEDDTASEATQIDVGTTQSHQFCDDAVDWVKFTASANHTYTITSSAVGQQVPVLMSIFGPDGRSLAVSSAPMGNASASSSTLAWQAIDNGDYFIQITNATSLTGCNSEYELTVTGQEPSPALIFMPIISRN